MNLYVTPNRNGLAKFSNSKGASSASKVSLESNLDSKLLQFSVRGGEKRRGNVDSSETGSMQLRTEGRRLKGEEEGRKVRFRRGNLTGERVQRMGRMGDRVTLSRGERRWMRGEGREGWMGRWMDGKTAKRREREKNFVRRKQASFERERERGAPLFEIAGWQNANYLALFPACKDACKKGATPLSFHIHTFPLHPLFDYPLYSPRCALTRPQRLQFFSLFVSSTSLFFFLFLSFFLDRHRWIKFSFIFVGFLWGKGFEVAYDPIFGFVKSGLVCALEIAGFVWKSTWKSGLFLIIQ